MFVKWPSIEGFHHVRKNVTKYNLYEGRITYRGKVKLHGTNAAIVIMPDGTVEAQSRKNTITPEQDNAGFARWVEDHAEMWARHVNPYITDQPLVIHGEWCGAGIQKGTAINKIGKRVFAVFALQLTHGVIRQDGEYEYEYEDDTLIIKPHVILDTLCRHPIPDEVYVLPWYEDDTIVVDYADENVMKHAVTQANEAVEAVEKSDPFAKKAFGADGTGEGLVYYPVSLQVADTISRWHLRTFVFKAKGEKHKNVKQKKAVQIDPEVAASIEEFVELVVTESRLEQGVVEACDGNYEHKCIGPFIKWVNEDIRKENMDELEAADLVWKQVAKSISTAARTWYIEKIESL